MFNKSFIVISLISLCLFITSCSSKNKDLVPDKSPDELYISAYDALSNEDYTLAKEYLEEIDKFIRLNPSDEHIDYLWYIRGLTNIQKSTDRMLDLIRIDRYDRDTSYMEQAYGDFNKLCNMYPKSLFIADAISRMIHIRNMLAKHELAVAKYYYKRQAYISTARRCQKILQLYKDSEQLEEALHLLADSYEHLNLIEPAQKTRQLINLNFN